jgi:hypothetical protein
VYLSFSPFLFLFLKSNLILISIVFYLLLIIPSSYTANHPQHSVPSPAPLRSGTVVPGSRNADSLSFIDAATQRAYAMPLESGRWMSVTNRLANE